jgi:hypothetical protein
MIAPLSIHSSRRASRKKDLPRLRASLLKEDDASFFAPEDIATLIAAFDSALDALRLAHREDPATLFVAKTIIDAAQRGERNPQRLLRRSNRDGLMRRTRRAP